ncbi:uncharacterized protein LOC121932750 isoform X2 [Sceloporus undulatus]|uniref:uncharacterized protein LOC121932750 isoform X2 n=1 Tax=Sceloporus undulatus TaxID=8520 RepID=UPI001C4D144B|nr:uncharacterized protein LOC121932750 isoform X2 [Sceloporus undulatus]
MAPLQESPPVLPGSIYMYIKFSILHLVSTHFSPAPIPLRSKMEEIPESPTGSTSQADKAAPDGFVPRISEAMAELLVNTVANTAKMVQVSAEAQKTAQLTCFHAEQALGQARLSYIAARGLAEQLLGFLSPPDYQGLFQVLSQPPMPYSEFCATIRRTENTLLHPVLKCKPGFSVQREPSPDSECSCSPEDGLQSGINDLQVFRSCCGQETEEDGIEEEAGQSLQIRGRNPSRHKQVETVLLEDQMGGAYVTQRRRSPRRSPSAGVDGLSPLVSEQELSTIQGGSGKFLSKVTRRVDHHQQENSDSDTDQSEISAKDTG